MKDLLVFAVVGCGLLATLRRPWVGILLYLWLAYLNPHRLCYGVAFGFPFTLVTVIVLLLALLFSREPKLPPFRREIIILLLFALWMTATTTTALLPAFAWLRWQEVMKILFMAVLLVTLMNSRSRINGVVWTIILSIGYYGVRGGIGTILSGGQSRIYGPDATFIADNNDIALALVTNIPLAVYATTLTQRRWAKVAMVVFVGLQAIAVVGTYSRGALLGLLAVSLFLCWKSRYRFRATALVLLLLLSVYLVAPAAWFERMNTIGDYQSDGSAMGRINAWHFALNLASAHPIAGGGFDVFAPELFQQYAPEPDNYHAAHSIYFKVLGEHGYVGLLLFLLLWISTWLTANRVRRIARRTKGAEWIDQLTGMAQVAMIGYAVGGSFSNLSYFDLPYHLMALIVACGAVLRQVSQDASTTDDDQQESTGLEPRLSGLPGTVPFPINAAPA